MLDPSLARVALDPETASRPALVTADSTYSFGELARRAEALRAVLRDRGIGAASRVSLSAPSGIDTVVAIFALLDLDATLVPIHPRLTSAEVSALLSDACPALHLGKDDLGALFDSLGSASRPDPVMKRTSLRARPPAAMLYTSGTTGRPKGAVLTLAAFVANAEGSSAHLGWAEHDRWLCCMPLCHIGGLAILTRCLLARRPVILEPRFDPEAVLESIRRHDATLLSVVPTMLRALLEADRGHVLARLRAVIVGGASAPSSLLEECDARGVRALTTYGLTECCSMVTLEHPSRPCTRRRGSGTPLGNVEMVIGSSGTIRVRGPMLMDGYFRGPTSPLAPAVAEDGFFDTGDLGEIDERGTLHVHARRTDLIVTGGENVYPVEVEGILESLPGVRRVLVFGVPDSRWGQLVAAVFELEPGVDLSVVTRQIPVYLAPHKRPRLVTETPSLALTSSGKLERKGARERYEALLRKP